MTSPATVYHLTPADVRLSLDPAWFAFETTAAVEPLTGIVGQARAVRALELGLGIRGKDYNIYVAGLNGASRLELVRQFIAEHAGQQPTPPDWIYVNNFDEQDRPLALKLQPGQAIQFKRDMRNLITRIREELPKAFRYEGFGKEKDRLREEYEQRSRKLFEDLEALAKARELSVQANPEGQLLFLPIRDGKPMTPEEAQQLGEAEIEQISKLQQEVFREAQPLIEQQHELTKQLTQDIKGIENTFANQFIEPQIEELATRYQNERITAWLQQVKQHMVDNLAQFRRPATTGPQEQLVGMMLLGASPDAQPLEYDVNVLADNTGVQGAPIIVEDVPTYKNLFGIIERTLDRLGRVSANFTQIKPGSILRANGGYVIFNIDDALTEPLVWKELKRTLKNSRIHIDTYEPISFFSTSGIKPEAIPIDTKVVLVGSYYVYHVLNFYDDEFPLLFKVKADFTQEMPLSAENCHYYAQLVRRITERENLPPFEAAAVIEMAAYGSRKVENRTKLSADFSDLADLVREAGYWARRNGGDRVSAAHVRQTLDERVYRSNWIAEKIQELIRDGTLVIDRTDKAVGQVNGLSIIDIGDYAFGRPSRVTASIGVGRAGVVNIERESRLSGRIHDKGMLILEGYLRHKYAQQAPVSLSASLAFEQSYSGVEGDSASAAEVFCLLSALAGLPLRQDIAVTGSVDQHGHIQAVGGVNEKIEGFFDICRIHGLTGKQGVCFPEANRQHLILRPDVVAAIERGQFHLWTMQTVDQGLQVLTGVPAGDINQPDSVHGRAYGRLQAIGEALKEAPVSAAERGMTLATETPPPPPGPPPLPPRG